MPAFLALLAMLVPCGPAQSRADDREDPREILREAKRDLRDPWPDARARAVRRLAELGTADAWELVVEALESEEPQVADQAQLVLGGLEDARWRKRLLGRDGLGHGDPWVRLRVAEAFGRMSAPVDGEALARAIQPREVELSRTLCGALERAADAGTLAGDRERMARAVSACLGRRVDARLAADALAARIALGGPDVEEARTAALTDGRDLLRAAAIASLVDTSGASRGGSAARVGLRDESPAVRRAAIDALVRGGDRTAARALVERLESEPRLRLRERLVAALQGLSGLRYRDDPRPWRRWSDALAEDWRAGTTAPDPVAPAAAGATRTSLASLPLRSDRIAVLVDFSGSLWAEREDGRTRKELLDVEIGRLLERLPETAEFNVIPYATEPDPWRDALVPATRRNVREAARDFERCRLNGKGNVWDAALVALADPRVDTLLVVTDGAPTGGHRWNLALLTDLLVRERRWSGVVVDSVLIDASARLQRRWRELAARTGGTSVAVSFE